MTTQCGNFNKQPTAIFSFAKSSFFAFGCSTKHLVKLFLTFVSMDCFWKMSIHEKNKTNGTCRAAAISPRLEKQHCSFLAVTMLPTAAEDGVIFEAEDAQAAVVPQSCGVDHLGAVDVSAQGTRDRFYRVRAVCRAVRCPVFTEHFRRLQNNKSLLPPFGQSPFLVSSLPLNKARSITGAPGLTRPFPPPADHQPRKDQSQPPRVCHPHEMCHPPPLRSAWQWRQQSILAFVAKSLVPNLTQDLMFTQGTTHEDVCTNRNSFSLYVRCGPGFDAENCTARERSEFVQPEAT